MKTFVMGDIHGNHRGMLQCFERSGFDYDNDRLIFLGDIVDGLPDIDKCIEELLKIKNCDSIMGNHDAWAVEWILSNGAWRQPIWTKQGGDSTMHCYSKYEYGLPPRSHIEFFKSMVPYFTIGEKDQVVFTHGGINHNQMKMERQDPDLLMWDRQMIMSAWKKHHESKVNFKFGQKKEIYVGHTTVSYFSGDTKPLFLCNVIGMDTGGGAEGKITIMDIDTKQYWQSELSQINYPDYRGREGEGV